MSTSASSEEMPIRTAGHDSRTDEPFTMSAHRLEELMNTPTGNPNDATLAELRKIGSYHTLRAADLLESLLRDEVTLKNQINKLRKASVDGMNIDLRALKSQSDWLAREISLNTEMNHLAQEEEEAEGILSLLDHIISVHESNGRKSGTDI